ncbi:MAG TPA: DUF4097 family beta strand repeat-containing protein [Sedimentisphaerales bacterium]|nr:DUF4097 family beta strand repeat-containing protein [Sedimentisphaerales bacterium]HRS12361.1 DUF4097 family beta strand repeat-containing protein [Sedimentisphaerales bacterium]HRV48901.1 DUF4097 family beta strand repeat-containing protein [Sedimentisphaerales bacterium]
MARIGVVGTLAFMALFVGCCVSVEGDYRAKAQRTANLTVPVADVTGLDIRTNVGTIRLESSDVSEVRITAEITVKAKTEEEAQVLVDEVQIVAEQSGRILVIKADKPSNFGRNQLAVDFTIAAPARLALDCTTNVGDIQVTGFSDRVAAKTDVGAIRCTDLRDDADLHTNVGDIHATYAADAPAALNITAATNVGNVDLTGPTEMSARLAASVNVGSIDTDRPLTITGKIQKSIKTTIGNAEGDVTLRTNVGSIRIR